MKQTSLVLLPSVLIVLAAVVSILLEVDIALFACVSIPLAVALIFMLFGRGAPSGSIENQGSGATGRGAIG